MGSVASSHEYIDFILKLIYLFFLIVREKQNFWPLRSVTQRRICKCCRNHVGSFQRLFSSYFVCRVSFKLTIIVLIMRDQLDPV